MEGLSGSHISNAAKGPAYSVGHTLSTKLGPSVTTRAVGFVGGGVAGGMTGGPIGAGVGALAGERAGELGPKVVRAGAKYSSMGLRKALPTLAKAAGPLNIASAVTGVGDLAQILEPNRKDIGFMGMSVSNPRSAEERAAHPALLNAIYDSIKKKLGY